MAGDIKVVGGNNNANIAFKNCHAFIRSVIHLNDEHIDTAENLDLTMNLYNLIEYSDNYSDTTASLYHYKRPKQNKDNDGTVDELDVNNSTSFEYQSNLIKEQVTPRDVGQNIDPDVANAHSLWKNDKIAVPLKYISNFFRSLEMSLINTKLYIELNWTKHSRTSNAGTATTFQITIVCPCSDFKHTKQ